MIKNNPLISVIIPVYNTGEFLVPCLGQAAREPGAFGFGVGPGILLGESR